MIALYLAIIPCIAVVLAYACIIAGARSDTLDNPSDPYTDRHGVRGGDIFNHGRGTSDV